MLSKSQTKKDSLIKSLVQFGLNPEQSSVYLAGISLGPSTVLNLSKKSGIPRTSVYSIISELIEKGLFKVSIIGFKKKYEAENPERLIQSLEQKTESLKKIIPDFLALYNLKDAGAGIKYYEGIESILPLYIESLNDFASQETLFVINNPEQWMGIDEKYFQSYREKRSKLPIKTKILLQDSVTAREFKKFERNFNEEIKVLPPETALNVDFFCTPKRVVIFQTQLPYIAIEIENKFIIELYKNLFEIIWKTQ